MPSGRKYSGNEEVRQWGYLHTNSYKEGERTAGEIYGVDHRYRPQRVGYTQDLRSVHTQSRNKEHQSHQSSRR